MNITTRRNIEEQIVRAAAEGLIEAGYAVDVYDGGKVVQAPTKDIELIMAALFSTDEDWIHAYNDSGKTVGFVRLVYGNDGWDVIQDHTVNLEPALEKAAALANQLAFQHA